MLYSNKDMVKKTTSFVLVLKMCFLAFSWIEFVEVLSRKLQKLDRIHIRPIIDT